MPRPGSILTGSGTSIVPNGRWWTWTAGGAQYLPYLLSGPGANRLITEQAVDDDLQIFGLLAPRMTIHLEHGGEHGDGDGAGTVDLVIGDETPDSFSFYLQLVGTRKVYTVDRTWYEVMERLVLEPPLQP